MQKCPKCGYDEGADWPQIMMLLSFYLLFVVYIVSADFAPRNWRFIGMTAFLGFSVGQMWGMLRRSRAQAEYLKLHPPPSQRGKDHLKTGAPDG